MDQLTVIPPYRWHGESDCLVGPFASRRIALFFIENLSFGKNLSCGAARAAEALVSRDGACYVDARRLQDGAAPQPHAAEPASKAEVKDG